MSGRTSSYKKIINFGNIAPRNPLAICMNNTIDDKFNAGVLADAFSGQGADNCQALLADYCGNGWDEYCEVASNNISTRYPNTVMSWSCNDTYNPQPPLNAGEQLIRNAAFKRFCFIPNAVEKCELFDPLNPMSPKICKPTSAYGSYLEEPVCRVTDLSQLNKDPLFIKMLENPRTCIDILVKMYQYAKENNQLEKLLETHFGKFVEMNKEYFQ